MKRLLIILILILILIISISCVPKPINSIVITPIENLELPQKWTETLTSQSSTMTSTSTFTPIHTHTYTPSFPIAMTETLLQKGNGKLVSMVVNRNKKQYFTTINIETGEYLELFSESFADPFSWSPDGKEIVYSIQSGRDSEIYRIRIDGTEKTLLTQDGYHPVWSHDGKRIAFFGHGEGSWALYVMDDMGNNIDAVDPRTVYDSYPEWSNDDSKILYLYSYDASIINIMMVESNGESDPILISNYDNIIGDPHISPDGNEVVFMSNKSGDTQIYVINIDGTGITQLTTSKYGNVFPVWSPDGNEILFMSNRNKKECTISNDCGMELYKMDKDGNNQKRLTENKFVDFYPTWSTSGEYICYFSEINGINPNECGSFCHVQLILLYADGSEQKVLHEFTDETAYYLTWQPG
jgi:TolB protein